MRHPPESLQEPFMALSTHIFFLSTEIPDGFTNASGTAMVLLLLIMVIYTSASILRIYFKRKTRW
jgi:ABC-type phosphate transport system permease subunit